MNKQELVETLKQVTDFLQEESELSVDAVINAVKNERVDLKELVNRLLTEYPEDMDNILAEDWVNLESTNRFYDRAEEWAIGNGWVDPNDENLRDVVDKYSDSDVCEFVRDFICDRI